MLFRSCCSAYKRTSRGWPIWPWRRGAIPLRGNTPKTRAAPRRNFPPTDVPQPGTVAPPAGNYSAGIAPGVRVQNLKKSRTPTTTCARCSGGGHGVGWKAARPTVSVRAATGARHVRRVTRSDHRQMFRGDNGRWCLSWRLFRRHDTAHRSPIPRESKMPIVVSVVQQKGGVGKTTLEIGRAHV